MVVEQPLVLHNCLTRKGKARLVEQTQQWQAVAHAMQTLGIVPADGAGLGVSG